MGLLVSPFRLTGPFRGFCGPTARTLISLADSEHVSGGQLKGVTHKGGVALRGNLTFPAKKDFFFLRPSVKVWTVGPWTRLQAHPGSATSHWRFKTPDSRSGAFSAPPRHPSSANKTICKALLVKLQSAGTSLALRFLPPSKSEPD